MERHLRQFQQVIELEPGSIFDYWPNFNSHVIAAVDDSIGLVGSS